MKKIKLRVSFDIVEDIVKQEEHFGITDEQKKKAMETTNFLQKHIKDIEEEIKNTFNFGEFQWTENLKVELLEVDDE